MADPIYITIEEEVVEIIEVGQQGPAGPQGPAGEGVEQDYIDAMDNANNPSASNPFATIADVPTEAGDIGAEPARGDDDNYVTDAEKTKLANTSGTNTGDQDLTTRLPTTATIYTAQAASFTVQADMLGKDVPVDITDGVITLPAWDGAGFGNGWQAKIVNLDSTAITYSGTVVASGTKQPAYSSRVIQIIGGTWYIGGLTT